MDTDDNRMDPETVDRLLEKSRADFEKMSAAAALILQDTKEKLRAENRAALEKYLDENLDEPVGETQEQYDGLLEHNIQAARHQYHETIKHQRDLMGARNFQILMQSGFPPV